MTSRVAPPIVFDVPAPRSTTVRVERRRSGERRRADRRFDSLRSSISTAEEREAAIAVALARSAELECFDSLHRRNVHVMLWLGLTATAVYAYDVLLLTGRLTLR